MPRDHARVNVAVWGDPDFRALPPQAQHLYLLLWSSPALTYCGTHDWRPARLAGLASGWAKGDVEVAAACLAARHFVVIDDDREEILLRSWMRFDGLLKQPRMAISCVTAYAAVASDLIRSVIVAELCRIREESPDLACWTDHRVAGVLDHPAASPKGWATPIDPFGDGVTPGLAQTQPLGLGSVSGRATPSPSPAPYSLLPAASADDTDDTPDDTEPKTPRRQRATRLPASWAPSDEHRSRAAEAGVDLDREVVKFRAYNEEKGRTAISWNAAFTRWLINAAEYAQRDGRSTQAAPPRRLQTVDELRRKREEGLA